VATAGVLDVHGVVVDGVPEPLNWDVVLTHKTVLPDIVGLGFTVTFCVTVHPTLLVYVITTDPADTPVTNPVLVTVAIPVLLDTHGFVLAAVTLPVNCIEAPTHTDVGPVIVGKALTVIVLLTVHPALFV
jgi:hypothetical protein